MNRSFENIPQPEDEYTISSEQLDRLIGFGRSLTKAAEHEQTVDELNHNAVYGLIQQLDAATRDPEKPGAKGSLLIALGISVGHTVHDESRLSLVSSSFSTEYFRQLDKPTKGMVYEVASSLADVPQAGPTDTSEVVGDRLQRLSDATGKELEKGNAAAAGARLFGLSLNWALTTNEELRAAIEEIINAEYVR